jgi:uncharacterized protein YuzE
MKVKYFSDTDTALLEFNDKKVYETIEINDNVYIDVDKSGNLVNITIEHAKENAKLPEFSYQELTTTAENLAKAS